MGFNPIVWSRFGWFGCHPWVPCAMFGTTWLGCLVVASTQSIEWYSQWSGVWVWRFHICENQDVFFLVQICLKLSTFFLSSWTWGVSKVYCAFFAHVFKLFVFFFCKSWNIHNQHQIPNFHVIGNYRTYQTQKLVIKKRYGWFHQ